MLKKDETITPEELGEKLNPEGTDQVTTLTGAQGPITPTDPSIRPTDSVNPPATQSMDSLVARVEELSKIVGSQQAQLIHLKGINIELNAEAAPTPKIPEKAVTYAKKKYKFAAPHFIVPGFGYVTADEAASRPEVMKWLVDNESELVYEYFA